MKFHKYILAASLLTMGHAALACVIPVSSVNIQNYSTQNTQTRDQWDKKDSQKNAHTGASTPLQPNSGLFNNVPYIGNHITSANNLFRNDQRTQQNNSYASPINIPNHIGFSGNLQIQDLIKNIIPNGVNLLTHIPLPQIILHLPLPNIKGLNCKPIEHHYYDHHGGHYANNSGSNTGASTGSTIVDVPEPNTIFIFVLALGMLFVSSRFKIQNSDF